MKRIFPALLALATTACVTGSDVEKLQSQIADLQEQVAQMKRTSAGKEEVQNVNQKIAEQTQTLLKSNAALVAKVDQIDEKMNSTQGGIEQTNYRVDKLAQQLTQIQHDVEELKAAAARAAAQPAVGEGPRGHGRPEVGGTQQAEAVPVRHVGAGREDHGHTGRRGGGKGREQRSRVGRSTWRVREQPLGPGDEQRGAGDDQPVDDGAAPPGRPLRSAGERQHPEHRRDHGGPDAGERQGPRRVVGRGELGHRHGEPARSPSGGRPGEQPGGVVPPFGARRPGVGSERPARGQDQGSRSLHALV
jgi:hypothetical protein